MGEKTAMGLDENIEGALCYLLGWVTGLIFYKKSPRIPNNSLLG